MTDDYEHDDGDLLWENTYKSIYSRKNLIWLFVMQIWMKSFWESYPLPFESYLRIFSRNKQNWPIIFIILLLFENIFFSFCFSSSNDHKYQYNIFGHVDFFRFKFLSCGVCVVSSLYRSIKMCDIKNLMGCHLNFLIKVLLLKT